MGILQEIDNVVEKVDNPKILILGENKYCELYDYMKAAIYKTVDTDMSKQRPTYNGIPIVTDIYERNCIEAY